MALESQRHPILRRVPGPGGVALAVWDYGGAGAPLILAHCTGGCARLWDPVAARLVPAFHVYALDQRGHGASDTPADARAYAWPLQGADVLAVCDAIGGGGPVVAVGHSSGGAHLLEAEVQRPGTFGGLVLLDPIVGTRFKATGTELSRRTLHRRSVFEDHAAARAHLRSRPPMDAWDARVLDALAAHGLRDSADGRVELCCAPLVEARNYEAGGDAVLEAAATRVTCPCLVVGGGDSFIAEAAEALAQRMPQATYRAMSGVSHFMPQEAPERVGDIIRSWLESLR